MEYFLLESFVLPHVNKTFSFSNLSSCISKFRSKEQLKQYIVKLKVYKVRLGFKKLLYKCFNIGLKLSQPIHYS